MKYKLILLDIDGTLRPTGHSVIPIENINALNRIKELGVKVAIATGRGRAAVPESMMNGFKPDFWICASGAQVIDENGNYILNNRMTNDQISALMDFYAEKPYPLGFAFDDATYLYQHYDIMHERELASGASAGFVDGCATRNRHEESLPFAAFARCPYSEADAFALAYPELKLKFFFYGDDNGTNMFGCDILQPEQDKTVGLECLAKYLGLTMDECVTAGDGINDIEMLKAAGLSYAMHDGLPEAIAAAKKITEPEAPFGVEYICKKVWGV